MKYRTIVADPPWEMPRSFGGANWRNGERTRPDLPYPTMSIEQIADVPVRDLAAKGAHLYLWTTQRFLRESYWITEAWGFTPSYALVWCKPPGGFVGGTFFSNVEFVLFCRRGALAAEAKVERQWFEWPSSEHSRKPDAFMDMVERVSPGPYLELFARRQRLGWDTWGDEALCHVDLHHDKEAPAKPA